MKDVHITRELLESIHKLDMPPEVLVRVVWEHVQALCPDCKEGIDSWQRSLRGQRYDSAFEKALAKIEAQEEGASEEARKVDREFAELLRLSPAEAVERVMGAYKRFRSPYLVERLIEESEKHLHGNPRRSVELLACARAIVERPAEEAGPDSQVEVLAYYGNALRAARETRRADDVLSAARLMLQGSYVKNIFLYPLLDSFQGSLRRQQSRFEEAEKHFARAVLMYRIFRRDTEAARVLLSLAYAYFRLARSEAALEAIHEAIEIIDPEEDLKLAAIARQNLASYLCDSGDPKSARSVLRGSQELLDLYVEREEAELFSLALVWLEGRIARNLGDHGEAEEKLLAAAEGFADFDLSYDLALVLLDLADSYLATGSVEAVKRLVPQIEPLLAMEDLSQEVIAALLLFQNAITQELLSTAVVASVRRKIEKVGRSVESS